MNAPTRYQFLIDGEVSDRVKAAFPELSVASAAGRVHQFVRTRRGPHGYAEHHGPSRFPSA